METTSTGTLAVVYTDGGARPNPGFGGYGCHGYIGEITDKISANGNTTVFPSTVGYANKFLSNEREFVKVDKYLDLYGPLGDAVTNNIGELQAFIKTCNFILSSAPQVTNLTILTDSKYLQSGINDHIHKWDENNWTGSSGAPISNVELWKQILALKNTLESKDVELNIIKVKAHSGDTGNERADALATLGITLAVNKSTQDHIVLSPVQGYWSKSVPKHPLISHKRLYFNSDRTSSVPGSYLLVDNLKDSTDKTGSKIGKKTPSYCFTLLRLNTPDPAIEMVKDIMHDVMDGTNMISTLQLDALYRKDIYDDILTLGRESVVVQSSGTVKSISVRGDVVSTVQVPASLALKATEYASTLNSFLTLYEDNKTPIKTQQHLLGKYTFHDITSEFYITNEKGKTVLTDIMKPTVKKHVYKTNVYGHNVKFTLLFGYDLPARNSLAKIVSKEPKVYIVTRKTADKRIMFFTCIETTDALGAWSNFFTNSIILT